jgi:Histidine kinase-, DNA gyrase B-, and HSP90-like ATPase
MTWLAVHAGKDHVAQFANRSAVEALAEMIWNGLDAEADVVEVKFETARLGGDDRQLEQVTKIIVTDDGHGMTAERANTAFASLGDSWKKTLNGRTVNGMRPLHGRLGRGRFYAYSLGHRVRWVSTADVDGERQTIHISGDRAAIDGFTIDSPEPSSTPTGTSVEIDVEQGRPLGVLLREDLPVRIAVRLAPHLLGHRDITVQVDGQTLDPAQLIDGSPVDHDFDDLPAEALGGRERPVMTIVDWKDEVRQAPGVVLCNQDGASLVDLEDSAAAGTVRSTGYLRWSGWAESGADLLLTQMQNPAIIDAAKRVLAEHVGARTEALTATIVTTLKEEGAYPYSEEAEDPLMEAEREMFDVVAVTARIVLRNATRQQRKVSAGLLRIALQDRPEDLQVILGEALALTQEERSQLADMLRVSSLGAIVRAATEVTRRTDLLLALRHLVYDPALAPEMREVDQLHPLVKDNVWLFGEGWRLSASEVGLTTLIRQVVGEDVALEADLVFDGQEVRLPDGRRGRVDLLLQRTIWEPTGRPHRLVVELKRPSIHLGLAEITQVEKYAQALALHPGAGPGRWTFWLIGSDVKSEARGRVESRDRAWGHVVAHEGYDVHVMTWGRLLDEAEERLRFYREQLNYTVSQDDAFKRVQQRHRELLPG